MALGGGTRQVFGADQGSAAAWNDIDALNGGPGLVLTAWPSDPEDGVELVGTVRSGGSDVRFTASSGALVRAAASHPTAERSHHLIWQQDGAWVALFSDTLPLSDLVLVAGDVELAWLADLEAGVES